MLHKHDKPKNLCRRSTFEYAMKYIRVTYSFPRALQAGTHSHWKSIKPGIKCLMGKSCESKFTIETPDLQWRLSNEYPCDSLL